MELIIKPTEACNFKCTFCSSTSIAESKSQLLSHDQIFRFLKRFPQTSTIIVNGGDPLVVKPDYYWKIISFLDQHNMPATISFTSNLWDFYQHPEKWTDLFRHPRMGIATSFNYGDTRRITKTRVYTEDIFWEVSNLFLEKVGYRPDFISVINDDNEDTALDNVRLAQKMNVECKLNYAMASGIQSKPYVLSKIYRTYLEVEKQGLTPWEFNTKQMIKRMSKVSTVCPQNRDCDSTIRCLQPAGDYYSCGAFGDDKENPISFEDEMNSPVVFKPLKEKLDIQFLKEECLTCPMFDICNGCHKTVRDLKRHNLVVEHCAIMKQNAPHILNLRAQARFSHPNEAGL
jgi:radical SAM protein with 4Fe4S-binding SPASM domain